MRLSLRRRLQVGLGAIAIAIAVLSLAAVLSLDRLGGAIATILRENYASVIACDQMKEALERLDSAAQFSTSGREDIATPMLAEHRALFRAALAKEAGNVTIEGEGERVREIEESYAQYEVAVDALFTRPVAQRSDIYFRDLLPRFSVLKDRIEHVLKMNQANMEAEDRRAKALAARTSRAALAASITAAGFAIWLAWWLPRSIGRPLEALADAARKIGEGRFDVDVPDTEVSELSVLVVAFRAMLARLRDYRESSLGELLAAKDLARATLSCMLDPVLVFEKGGSIALANEACEAAFGLDAGSTPPLDLPGGIAAARDHVFEGRGPLLPQALSEAMRTDTADGTRYYLVRSAPLTGSAGQPERALVIAQDVTRFRRIDELKSDMVATVSHEFKTPLTSLRMATHLLLEPTTGTLTEGQLDLVTTAKNDTERLRAMVEDLLDVVRIEREAGAPRREAVDPRSLLEEVAAAHRTVASDKAVRLEVSVEDGLSQVLVDPERMSIALANLVSNAIRHSSSGGSVTLVARRAALGGRGGVELTVRDEGEGMSADDLGRLFKSDRVGDDQRPPTSHRDAATSESRHGLGLAIAREIAVQHGGDLTFESAPNRGSKFTFTLPGR